MDSQRTITLKAYPKDTDELRYMMSCETWLGNRIKSIDIDYPMSDVISLTIEVYQS